MGKQRGVEDTGTVQTKSRVVEIRHASNETDLDGH